MPALASQEKTLLRTHPHACLEYLAVLQPGTILACQLNGAPSSDPVVEINYDNVTEGSYTDVVPGMTLWVGSAAGKRDKGTCRVRKDPTSSILYIAEDSKIDWADNDHLTVVESYELWVKYPRVVVSGSSLTIYKDWEVAYSDQHEDWPPVAILGPPDCQFIDPGSGQATCKFVGEHSYPVAPGASISSYSWSFPGGTPSSSSSPGTEASPVEVTWDTTGTYWVTLTVTDSNGKTHTGRRPIFIFERTGSNMPYTRFKMTSRSGDISQHGHTASVEIHGDADQAEFPDRALVVYFTEDWYGSTKQSIGGNYKYREHIKFAGYIQQESTRKDPQTSVVMFDAATVNGLMDTREGFSCWLKDHSNPGNWTQAKNLTADRAALSLVRYQSTLLDITDVIVSDDTLYIASQEFDAKTSLLQQLQGLYTDLFAHVACDKQGRVYFEKDPQMLPVASRSSIPTVVDLQHGDWKDELELPRPQEPKTSFINLEGVAYPGGGRGESAVVPVLSKAPGDAPAYMGQAREITGLILSSQADGNEKAGLALARDNNEFPDVPIPMAGFWDVFDIVPQEYVTLSLAASDTKRGIVWSSQKLIPRRVELTLEETETGRVPFVRIGVEKDSFGPSGVDGDYPDEVPDYDPDITPYPPPPPPPPGGEPADGHLLYMVCENTGRVFRSRNARASNPASVVYEDLGVVDSGGLHYIALDSWDCKNRAMVCGPNGVWRTENLNDSFPSWECVYDTPSNQVKPKMVLSSICQNDLWVVAVATWNPTYGQWYPKIGVTEDFGDTWSWTTTLTKDWYLNSAENFKIELSAHSAGVAWATWTAGSGVAVVSKTTDKWSTWDNYGVPGFHDPAGGYFHCYHRYTDNPSDNYALWGARDASQIPTVTWCTGDYATCQSKALNTDNLENGVLWVGGYTLGTNRYWALASSTGWKFFVSDDALTWVQQYAFTTSVRFISGWPFEGERFYACQDGTTAPLLISDDRGENWQEQTGNWASLGYTGAIACCVPVWIE